MFENVSSLGVYNLNIGRFKTDIIVQDNAWVPYVSENISIIKPMKKDNVISQFRFNENGNFIMKYINNNGVATLNKHK